MDYDVVEKLIEEWQGSDVARRYVETYRMRKSAAWVFWKATIKGSGTLLRPLCFTHRSYIDGRLWVPCGFACSWEHDIISVNTTKDCGEGCATTLTLSF